MCPDDLSVAVCGVQKFEVSVNQWLKGERVRDTNGEHIIVLKIKSFLTKLCLLSIIARLKVNLL